MFKPHDGCVAVSLEKEFYGSFSCLVGLFVVEIHCACRADNFKAGGAKKKDVHSSKDFLWLVDKNVQLDSKRRWKYFFKLFLVQDLAAERCTMPFRAPELFQVPLQCTIDEKVDIWVSRV